MSTTPASAAALGRSFILLSLTAFLLDGCHARSGGCGTHHAGGSDSGDGLVAAFYLFYILGWIIVSAAEG